MKSVEQVARDRAQKLKLVEKEHAKAVKALHDKFNSHYDRLLDKHDLTVTGLMDHHSFPQEFHDDLAEHKAAFLAAKSLADSAKQARVATIAPRAKRFN